MFVTDEILLLTEPFLIVDHTKHKWCFFIGKEEWKEASKMILCSESEMNPSALIPRFEISRPTWFREYMSYNYIVYIDKST